MPSPRSRRRSIVWLLVVPVLALGALSVGACARGPRGPLDISVDAAPNLFQSIARVATRNNLLVHASNAASVTLRTREGDWLNYAVVRGQIRFHTNPPGDPTRHPARHPRRIRELEQLGHKLASEAYAEMGGVAGSR